MKREQLVREHVVGLLRDGNAHITFAEAVADFPEALINTRPANVPYTFWHLIEHLRLTQLDILEYVLNADYEEREWPEDYWPPVDAMATKADWDKSVASFQRDLDRLIAIVADAQNDLLGTVPSHDSHTLLREALIVADHNAYHIGELGILRQVEKAWPPSHSG